MKIILNALLEPEFSIIDAIFFSIITVMVWHKLDFDFYITWFIYVSVIRPFLRGFYKKLPKN